MKRIAVLAACAAATLGVAACGSSSSSSSSSSSGSSQSASAGTSNTSFKVCMATGGAQNGPWADAQGQVMSSMVKKAGWTSVTLDNNNSAATAVSNAQVFVQDKCSAVVEFNGQTSVNPAMAAKFAAAKIPVITYDIAQKGWYFIGIDNSASGAASGKSFGEWIKQHWNCKVDAVIAAHAYEVGTIDTERTDGSVTGIESVCPNITKSDVFNINGGGLPTTADSLARSLLSAHSSWHKIAVVGINDPSVTGVLEAAQQEGRFADAYGWGQDGSLITSSSHNPHMLGSNLYFLEGYPEYTYNLLKAIESGHPPVVKDNVDGKSPMVQIQPCPVTAAQAAKVPSQSAIVSHLQASAPGTKPYSLYCPAKQAS